eukprot:972183-Amphidinium_carterae.1
MHKELLLDSASVKGKLMTMPKVKSVLRICCDGRSKIDSSYTATIILSLRHFLACQQVVLEQRPSLRAWKVKNLEGLVPAAATSWVTLHGA